MPKVRNKFYAVKIGRGGPAIYTTWDECKAKTERFPGAVHKSFTSKSQAEAWLRVPEHRVYMRDPEELTQDEEDLLWQQFPRCATEEPPEFIESGPSVAGISARTEEEDFIRLDEAMDTIPPPPPREVPLVLSPEQMMVLAKVKQGGSVFFTGSAGTGKSVLLREIISSLRENSYERDSVAITASTGIAAVNIGGSTLHSWAGIGLGAEPKEKLAGKLLGQKKVEPAKNRWRQVKTLIIDEISMIDGVLFDKLEYVARALRFNDKPFGGIQLVLSGDFCQLPPVPGRSNGVQIPAKFAFDSDSWSRCIGKPITLKKVFRQKDQAFVDMLNSMRFGKLTPQAVTEFRKLSRRVVYDDAIEPTELYPTRREVEEANRTRLQQLPDPLHTYVAQDVPGVNDKGERVSLETMERLLERLVATKEISLKIGAQVMLIKNLVQGSLVNGSLGQIIEFRTPKDALRDHVEIAQAQSDNKQHPYGGSDPRTQTAQLPQKLLESTRVWPLVQFTNGEKRLCVPAEFTVNNASGDIEAKRDQVPLILAWALSVHKSQGQTLERVKVDLGRTFEKGQAYVALSRATGMAALQVLNFVPSKVEAHPRVLQWYNQIEEDDMFDSIDGEMDSEEAMAAYYDQDDW